MARAYLAKHGKKPTIFLLKRMKHTTRAGRYFTSDPTVSRIKNINLINDYVFARKLKDEGKNRS